MVLSGCSSPHFLVENVKVHKIRTGLKPWLFNTCPPLPPPPTHTHTHIHTHTPPPPPPPPSPLSVWSIRNPKKVYTKYKTYSWKRLIAATRSAWASPISENVLIYPFAFKKSLNERKTYVTKIDIDFPCNLPMKETLNKSFSEKRHRAQRYLTLFAIFFWTTLNGVIYKK